MSRPVVEMRHISKSFGHIRAVSDASMTVEEGQVTAIVGDNGSGKSTLIKILSGNLKPDGGTIAINGEEHKSLDVRSSLRMGVRTVYQDLALDNTKNSVENIFLGHEITSMGFLMKRVMRSKAEQLLDDLNITIPDLETPVANLSGGQRQGLAIARALNYPGQLLILDEPTAAMGLRESRNTIDLMKKLKAQGVTQLIISHNLHQVFEVSDRIYIMRAGEIIMSCNTRDSSEEAIQRAIMDVEDR